MNKISNTQRQPWIDVIRGICSVLVIFSHIPSSPVDIGIFYAPIMIPSFFFVSGYLGKNYNGNIVEFLYNRVLKLFIFRFIAIFEINLISVNVVIKTFQNPLYLIKYIAYLSLKVIIGRSFWFISCLIVVSIYFIVINKLCKNKPVFMLSVSLAAAAFGLYISTPGVIVNWSWDTALVCQFFYVTGYCVKQKQWIEKVKFTPKLCLLIGTLYTASVIIFAKFLGINNILIIVANNTWRCIPVTSILILLGISFIICLSRIMQTSRLLTYIGKHSLLYFTMGGLCLSYCNAILQYIYTTTHFEPLNNIYITCMPILIVSTLLTLIPCWLSDKFCPALNGTIYLPELKLKKVGK
ncbi:MAG: acyltransferase family protein [Acutalibacteraceae bacterium]